MENKHTPEPWKTVFRGDEGGLDIDAFVSNGWGDYVTLAINVGEANASRIVACVNACAGIETIYLEAMRGTSILEKANANCDIIMKQRDELLSALERIAAGPGDNRLLTAIQWAKEAIDKVKGRTANAVSDADGWIDWKGGECPVGAGVRVDVRFLCGDEHFNDPADLWTWGHHANECDIIAYRVVKGGA